MMIKKVRDFIKYILMKNYNVIYNEMILILVVKEPCGTVHATTEAFKNIFKFWTVRIVDS